MLVSYKLLSEYVDVSGLTIKEVTDRLSLAGFELDGMEVLAQANHLVIGEVLECVNHPDSDHLHVTKTNIGKETLQIVCGAPNCRTGLKVIVALPGAELPAKGITIGKGSIRGVESNGMLCSLLELGVNEDTLNDYQKAGIEELPEDAVVGNENVLEYLNLDDTILDISVTPNRADALGLYNFFIDVAAILNRKLIKNIYSECERKGSNKFECSSDTNNCDFFSISYIENIQIKPSPVWMQNILKAHGIKVINNIVDIGNYVTLMTGQPLHMYDADKLASNKFVVKDNFNQDVIALDGKSYHINPGDLVVTNGNIPVCIAGVIGDDSTKIDENTKNIALEAALFDGTTIMNSCKRYGILTVAATNYSKLAVDRYSTEKVSDIACNLLKEYASAKSISNINTYDKRNLKDRKVEVSLDYINGYLATNFTLEEVKSCFDRLMFNYNESNNNFVIDIPTYRNDIEIKQDIVEEVIRLLGFENVPYNLTDVKANETGLNEIQHNRKTINEYLLNIGLTNTLSYTLINKDESTYYNIDNKDEPIILPHPLTEQKEYLRLNMICSMLKTIQYNQSRNTSDVAIYELSQVYSKAHLEGQEKLAIAISNNFNSTKWLANKETNFYLIKGIVEGLLNEFGLDNNRYMFENISKTYPHQTIFHPGKSATLKINGKVIGILGEIHPLTLKREGIDKTVYFEMNLTEFFNIKTSKVKYSQVSKYPTVTRDIAIIVKEDIDSASIIKSIKKAGGSMLINVEVFDVYKGEHIEKGYKSVAFKLSFNDPTKTLTEQTINELFNKVLEACQKEHNASLR